VSVSDLREVHYEDLLGREQVDLDTASIADYVTGRRILVTGAGGSIGSELCRQIIRFSPAKLILLDASELNLYHMRMELEHELGFKGFISVLSKIQNREHMEQLFEAHQPSVVFHAAAYKHVPLLEENPWEAVYNNILGSRILMEAASTYHAEKFVLVSTDKAVRPTNVMGASKRVAELLLHAYNRQGSTQFMAVRFGNVVGSSGSVIPLFKRQIERGGPVTVTHPDMTRYFMTIHEAAQLILQAGALGEGGEIFVLEMGTPVRIDDMARDLIKLMGKEPDRDIEILYTGLRPGEKIAEELITDEEGIASTEHKDILVLKQNDSRRICPEHSERLLVGVDELQSAAIRLEAQDIRDILMQLVPEYRDQMREGKTRWEAARQVSGL
jgi:FlaA1/EpsC-like NDP-sugar epimerase